MDLDTLITSYQAPQLAADTVQSTKILLLVGISGAGKDTIKRQLLKKGSYMDIVSHTTRAPRTNSGVAEVDGVDYHFIDTGEATQMVENRAFIEVKYVHGTVYGTAIEALNKARLEDKIAVTDLDVQGVAEYKQMSQDVIALFILPPDYATWRQRFDARYATKEELEQEWPKRRLSAISELEHALEVSYYHFIINDDLDRAIKVVDEIAQRGDMFNRHDDEARLAARDLLEAIKSVE